MNFTRLLAAGRSVKGIKKDPGPYRMNQEHLLPRFDVPVHKAVADLMEEEPIAGPGEPAVENEAALATAAYAVKAERKKGLLGRMVNRLIRWNRRPSGPKSGVKLRSLVQAELSLDEVKVVRNDLKDSDFELAVRAGASAGANQTSGRSGTAGPMGVVWNRLSARLLRQAVQDFNVVQKERGKLLPSAGSDRRSPRGA